MMDELNALNAPKKVVDGRVLQKKRDVHTPFRGYARDFPAEPHWFPSYLLRLTYVYTGK